ncbi:adenylate/guanylate cyclase domain-containing protein [Sneathiella limimaris]|uniref:adenylate/guanylate cyclase domain-containing protein n=1 Tax=Sneathiella limimaris TaxID=1964213 RepID=UPI00146F1B31|nr:adenylate/guanylate cyclase domain-containing protein [Sneathiella limimaris]
MTTTVERKLTTILCADVAGYSRLMEQDEVATLNDLKIARVLFQEQIEAHGGRLINMAGDGIIAEFPSVVNAVQGAVTIQNLLEEKHAKGDFDVPMHFRIGLNLGDVMIEGDDIFGDGVNIASRLEAMAPTGGICISGTVYDHVKNKLPASFTYLGEKHVKNIEGAVPVYSLGLAGETAGTQTQTETITNSPEENYSPEDQEEAELRKQVRRKASYYRRCMMMGSVIIFLFFINILSSPDYLWFIWPALPMLLVLAMDGFRVFGKGHFSDDWENREMEKEKRRRNRHR